MLYYSSCTQPPCLAIVADILKIYKKLVPVSNNEIRLLPQPCTPLQSSVRRVLAVWSTLGDTYDEIPLQKSETSLLYHTRFSGLCRHIAWTTIEVSHYGQGYIGHVALYVLWVLF
jgi:hypothetical protein